MKCNSLSDSEWDLIRRNSVLVKRIASEIHVQEQPACDIQDLAQHGLIGLLLAAKMYRAEMGCSFQTYAAPRVRDAILDGARTSQMTSQN